MSGEPTANPRADVAEWQIDLVVHDEDVVKRHPERTTGGTDGRAGVVHVRLGQQDRNPRPTGSRPALGEQAFVLRFRLRQPPARRERVRDLEPDVVARARVLGARVAESDQ